MAILRRFIKIERLKFSYGLRLAFAIDGGKPQIVEVDIDTVVTCAEWAQNVLNRTTVGISGIRLEKADIF